MQKLCRLSSCPRPTPGPVLSISAISTKSKVLGTPKNKNRSKESMPLSHCLRLSSSSFLAIPFTHDLLTSRAKLFSCRASSRTHFGSAGHRAWGNASLRHSEVGVSSPWRCETKKGFTATEGSPGGDGKKEILEVAEEAKEMVENRDEEENQGKHQCLGVVSKTTERRQRGVTGKNVDLLAVPGIGPRNLRKLVDKGIGDVAELKQLYKNKFIGKASEKMVEYLQSSVGIIHKNHAERITSFIKDTVDEELKEDGQESDRKPSQKKRLTFCVEGNISVGKTTFLQRIANETIELRDLVEIVPEPIAKWQDIGPEHFNILDAFYAEPERYAYTFQNYVFVTRVMQERESCGGIKPLRLMERSVFSDRMVFVRAVHEANWMNEMEISIYDSWFDPVVSTLPGLIPDGFIYLRASPDTCHKRMMLRRRDEEGGVSLDYLRGLHEKHESWLFPFQSGNHGVLSVNQLPSHLDSSLHPDIKDRVFYLEGNHMHPSIQRVPALVLDCEPNIDFSKDIDAKQQYARQVAEFFEFVKKKQEMATSQSSVAEKNYSQHFSVTRQDGLWLPGGTQLPESLRSLDLGRTISFT